MAAIASKIKELAETLEQDEVKFTAGNHAAGTRMRKTLQEIKRVAQQGRKDVQASKNAESDSDDSED